MAMPIFSLYFLAISAAQGSKSVKSQSKRELKKMKADLTSQSSVKLAVKLKASSF